MQRKWTDDELAKLKAMMEADKPSSEIAEVLGRTIKAVEHRKSALRHPKPTIPCKNRLADLTPQQRNWLIRHFKHTKNDEIMAKLRISHSSLHRFAREHGLTKSRQFMDKTQQGCTDAAHAANRERGWPPKGYRIPGSEGNCFQKGITPEMRLGKKRNEERKRKAAASLAKLRAADRRRAIFGLPTKTKLGLGFSDRKRTIYRHELRKRGYIIPRGGRTAYVTDETLRSLIVEQRAAQHGIKVVV